MEWWLLTFFFSAILSLFMPIVPAFSLLLTFLLCSLLLIFTHKFRLLAIAMFAITWVLVAASQYKHTLQSNDIAKAVLHKQAVLLQGKVDNIVQSKKGNSRFNFLISHWKGQPLENKFKIRLSWKAPSETLLQGQIWQLLVKLKPAHGLANVGGFNYQVWLLQKQIVATGYVKADKEPTSEIILKKNNILINSKPSWRQELYQKIETILVAEPLGGLILALGFGERGKLSSEHWQVLSATATQHLIAISGLHIGIVAFASLIFIRAIIGFLPLIFIVPKSWRLSLMTLNVRYLPVVFSCFMAWYYAYLAGFSIPTLRALVMLLLFWLLKISGVQVSLLRWFLFAIVFIILIWPLSLLSASFWLSISALVIIFATFSRFTMKAVESEQNADKPLVLKINITHDSKIEAESQNTYYNKFFNSLQMLGVSSLHWLKTLAVMQFALTLAMLPIAASLNYQLPLAAFVANIVAVPLMSISVIPLTLLAVISVPFSLGMSQFFIDLALLSLSIVWQWLSYLTDLKWAVLAVSQQQIQALLLLFTILALALYFRIAKGKIFAVLSLFLVTFSLNIYQTQHNKDWQLSVLDVGHGLAIVVEKNRHVFIYDTGASYPSGFNMADAALIPYLKHHGYKAIDGVIISHNDNDHAGSLNVLRSAFDIQQVIANDEALMPDRTCIAGQQFTWQGLTFEMLSPTQAKGDKNDDSCVVTISDDRHRVLLPGDISIKQEKKLLSVSGIKEKLTSDLLIAPHHGSKSSSSPRFLAAVTPKYVVFSAGYLNRWKMPSTDIRSRYSKFDIRPFNTAEHGMVTFIFSSPDDITAANANKTDIEVISYRGNIRPYWYVN